MKKQMKLWTVLLLTTLLFTGCGSTDNATSSKSSNEQGGNQALTVYASIYPMYDFASKIGGDKVNVNLVVPSGTEAHSWEPTAKDITQLEGADVFVYNGSGMEHWVEDVLASLQNKDLIVVEASKNINYIEGHSHAEDDSAHSDQHETTYDPHVWLDPQNAKIEMENIKNAFTEADPDNSDYYESNYKKYAAECDKLDQEFADTLTPLPNKDIVVSHEAYGYLCEAYGLNQVGIEGLNAESDPDPARMAEIIDFAKENHVTTIFFEETVSSKVADTIAKEVGANTAVLSPIESLSEEQQTSGEDYFSVMRQNLSALETALQ